jgi:hypothetical protein
VNPLAALVSPERMKARLDEDSHMHILVALTMPLHALVMAEVDRREELFKHTAETLARPMSDCPRVAALKSVYADVTAQRWGL